MKTRSGSKSESADLNMDTNFKLHLIEAFKDKDVQSMMREVHKSNVEATADLVCSKLEAKFAHLHRLLESKDKRIADLEKTVEQLTLKQDDVEQYSRRTSVRISGIPETQTEDVAAISMDIFKVLDVSPPVINRVHRIGPKRTVPDAPPRPILCQFLSYGDKAEVMKRKKLLKERQRGVYISEDLTRRRASILYQARTLVRQKKIRASWSSDGVILILDNRNTIRRIVSAEDLTKYA